MDSTKTDEAADAAEERRKVKERRGEVAGEVVRVVKKRRKRETIDPIANGKIHLFLSMKMEVCDEEDGCFRFT